MWRIGVLIVATALLDFTTADVKPTDSLLVQRLKRSPNYCDNYGYYSRQGPRSWPPRPPPPPPPFWPPPPPPPPFWPPPPPPPPSYPADYQGSSKAEEPCSTCGGNSGVASSISNAKSDNGDAIAVAVAKASH